MMIKGTLNKLIEDCSIEFKYFVTIPYRFKQTDLRQVHWDNKGLRRTIRDFYQYPIRTWFFNEVHTDPDSRHFGGIHRHLLVEDIPAERWRTPSKRMERFLSENDAEALSTALSGGVPTVTQKVALLRRVVRLHPSTPNGLLGLRVDLIYDLKGILGYCTKQIGEGRSIADVIDLTASDIDPTNSNWNGTLTRQKALSF
tara:strand:+ start:1476 stop:2072 length:597 start_codon:yes stop_codon:yes gene_type:complete